MAIPIGGPAQNYGVIKIVNSTFRCSWFTEYDARLGRDLAARLHVMFKLFLHIQQTERASEDARRNESTALSERQRADEAARQRQLDLMTITHQVQGALIAVINALSSVDRKSLSRRACDLTEHAQAIVEDGLALAYGTCTTFAQDAGRKTAFTSKKINVPEELRSLANRLQRTNARQDLHFKFKQQPGFPAIELDHDAFTSVIYSLIHNAMKYSDVGSTVDLECGVERNSGEVAVKVKSWGEPILPAETEKIFQRFGRGRNVEKGRLHSGVGLGLWVARTLMRALGGDLTVELSPSHPRLSVFIIYFPRS
jgi:signal transduction histidine kinase